METPTPTVHLVACGPEAEGMLEEAIDECARELALRKRCYPRWIEEGRISRTDARDRLARLETAVRELTKLQSVREVPVTSSGDMTEPDKPF